MKLIPDERFYVKNRDTYPPFKNGLYLEEYFFNYMKTNDRAHDKEGRLYIPSLWTNFQIESWFGQYKTQMQASLDRYIANATATGHDPKKGYFTVVQHDNGPELRLPENTIVYGACKGNVPIPLIYEDRKNNLVSAAAIPTPSAMEATPRFLASFVGTRTHHIRHQIYERYARNPKFTICQRNEWTATVNENLQSIFINSTIASKFALAPRGFGAQSFRYYEIIKMGRIPVYIWSTVKWLPYEDVVDYDKFSVTIHEDQINNLEQILENITPEKYAQMREECEKIKPVFELDFMCHYICIGITTPAITTQTDENPVA